MFFFISVTVYVYLQLTLHAALSFAFLESFTYFQYYVSYVLFIVRSLRIKTGRTARRFTKTIEI